MLSTRPATTAPGKARSRGFTLVELVIAMAIFAILLAMGLPAYHDWAIRSKIRVTAETMLTGLVLARDQALQRNSQVQFSLTNTLAAGCSLGNTYKNWIVSVDDPDGLCNVAPSDTVDPRIIQKRAYEEGDKANLVGVTALNTTGGAADNISFTGLGRQMLTDASGAALNSISRIDISYPSEGTCIVDGGAIRCLRIQITPGGDARLCDPDPTIAATDPRYC